MTLYLGCAVWAYDGWIGNFYPPQAPKSTLLQLYSQRLTALEGNTTFYAVPSPATVQRWQRETPPDFRFCLKFPQTISHQGLLCPHITEAQQFLERLHPLGQKLGMVFLQLPPTYGPGNLEDLHQFLAVLADFPVPLAVEVRHRDWWSAPLWEQWHTQRQNLGVSQVILDTRPIYNCPDDPQQHSQRRKPNVPVVLPAVTPERPLLVRFISHPQPQWNQPYLQQWQTYLERALALGQTVYFFVHCPQEQYSPFTARAFYHQLQQKGLALPSLPWDQLPQEPQQLSLF
ncbi:DUF72 domain-containing protein [Synechocystis sp. LKSZ1]|uniref:DUF72 domain-containing protein n=1 Tax=Synechocystis sp. LKSZ1 TaxID=3144951 RepID=UPI00336BC6BC